MLSGLGRSAAVWCKASNITDAFGGRRLAMQPSFHQAGDLFWCI